MGMRRRSGGFVLSVNPILCDGYGHCGELAPDLVHMDEWGYPIVADEPIPRELARETRMAVSMCPRLALLVERRPRTDRPAGASSQ